MAIIRMHCEEIPAPPRARNHDIPEPLNRLVLRLLAKDPAARPATVAQVAIDLTQISDALAREAVSHGTRGDGGHQA